jgi:hypothetical protein
MTPPPHKEAMELAREFIESWADAKLGKGVRPCGWPNFGSISVSEICSMLIQRDAQVWAEAIERAAQHVHSRAEAHRKSISPEKGERFNKGMADICEALDMIADHIRTLSRDPHWLERERLRIEEETIIWCSGATLSEKDAAVFNKRIEEIQLRRAELEKLLAAPGSGKD